MDLSILWQSEITSITILSGLLFLIAGLIVYFVPPKKINGLYGYRTEKSMKSQERWDFAQIFAAKKMILSGVILCIVGLLAAFVSLSENLQTVVGLSLLISSCIYLFVSTEKAITQKFED